MREELMQKVCAIKEIGEAIAKHIPHIEDIHYEIWQNIRGFVDEYLVIQYRGGAYSVRNCTANSISATVQEIAERLNGGYYSEVDTWKQMHENPDWTKLEV